MPIDYKYIHNKKCELIKDIEGSIGIELSEQQIEKISNAMQDIAFHEVERIGGMSVNRL